MGPQWVKDYMLSLFTLTVYITWRTGTIPLCTSTNLLYPKRSMLCNSSWLYLGQISPPGLQSSNVCHVYFYWICNKQFLNLEFLNFEALIWRASHYILNLIPQIARLMGANMGPTWVLSAPDGPHVGPINLAIRGTSSSWELTGDILALGLWSTCIKPSWVPSHYQSLLYTNHDLFSFHWCLFKYCN